VAAEDMSFTIVRWEDTTISSKHNVAVSTQRFIIYNTVPVEMLDLLFGAVVSQVEPTLRSLHGQTNLWHP
jgi:hypothetical protein